MKYKITETWLFEITNTPPYPWANSSVPFWDTLVPWDFSKVRYCSKKAAQKALTRLEYDDNVLPAIYSQTLKKIMDDSIANGHGTVFEIVDEV